jgi:hypothetical protein
MNASSDDSAVLGKVRTGHICRLLLTISGAELRSVQFIEKTYSAGAVHFSETLGFLLTIGWVSDDGGHLRLTRRGEEAAKVVSDEAAIRAAILGAVTVTSSHYRPPLAAYLREFRIIGDMAVRQPSLEQQSQERTARDFLMDLRAVTYDASRGGYVLNDSASSAYVWAANFGLPKNKATLDAQRRRREELGFAAEQAVVAYEQQRVGRHANAVEHVSAEQPFACYDVKSVTVTPDSVEERFIEVKAVSDSTFQFYWSRAELDVAKLLRDRYFLYLLPYRVRDGFDTDALVMICNPYQAVYQNHEAWDVEQNVVICRKRPDPAISSPG